MNYYAHHLGDYMRDTAHLSLLEDGAYRRLLDLYYAQEAPLPSDLCLIFRKIRVVTRAEKKAVETVLQEFFVESGGFWHHKRCDEEIARAHEKTRKARESAEKRWNGKGAEEAMPTHSVGCAEAMRTHSEGNAPNSQEPITKEEGRARKRATRRCPEDFEVTPEMREWARTECPGVDVDAGTAKFRDHTYATARIDWLATWRNWMRNEKPRPGAVIPMKPKPAPTPEQISEAQRRAAEENIKQLAKLGLRP